MIEPGRSIVGEAGTTLYTVGFIKETPHKKNTILSMADDRQYPPSTLSS